MKISLLVMGLSFVLLPAFSAEKNIILDPFLRERLNFFNIRPLKNIPANSNRSLVELGKNLFSDTIISGNKRMSCQTCHSPEKGTSDSLSMSRTEDGTGILRRNTPHIFNAGIGNKSFMFWDGRIHYHSKKKVFTTPEPALNGENPKAHEIASAMTSALAAQALFPMVNQMEMMGKKGENEVADAKDNLEAWERIVARLKNNKRYYDLFARAFPDSPREKINIGNVAEAIAAFEMEEFQSTGSPFQRYLKGDDSAMTNPQKRGLVVFLTSGKCINCHQGSELGNSTRFASVSTPQWGEAPFVVDKGRGEINHEATNNYFFKVPSLLNVALTAPYMHNGAFETLKEVINHYDRVGRSLRVFEISDERRASLPVKVEVEKYPGFLDEIWLSSQVAQNPELKNNLFLTPLEKKYLRIFLSEALTDPKWVRK